MLFVHGNNLQQKIKSNYKDIGGSFKTFFDNEYTPAHRQLIGIKITPANAPDAIRSMTQIFNAYYDRVREFVQRHAIKAQSKFESSFLEEMSAYLFKDLPQIQDGAFDVFNKRIYAGLKIEGNSDVKIITKDVDFCIGKKVQISIDGRTSRNIVLPIVAVEVKTYLDATMFGEVKSSSRAIKNASPNAKTYVLMGYPALKRDHMIAARNDSALTEMFALRENGNDAMRDDVLLDYWREIYSAIQSVETDRVNAVGRLLHP